MENINEIPLEKEKEKEELKRGGPSELALSLRKKKINQILSKNRIIKEKKLCDNEFESNEMKKLCDLSKYLYEEKNIEKIKGILDQIYFFFINFKTPIESNYIDISALIQHLYTKMLLYKNEENVISKSFDIFDQLIRLTPYQENEDNDKFIHIFNNKYSQILYELIDFYQKNNKISEKIFCFLTSLIEKSNKIKEYLMVIPGLYLIQTFFSLDTKYPILFIKLMTAFCTYQRLNDITMKDFEIMFTEKCEKILSLFYNDNHKEPKDVINNSLIFRNLYKCLSYISQSTNKEIQDAFLINKKNDISLYEKMLFYVKFDQEHLSLDLLIITGNLFCCTDKLHIQTLIECKSYQWVFGILSQQYNNNKVLKCAAWALSNFVNNDNFRKFFLDFNYINDLILVLKRNNSYEVMNEVLYVMTNVLDAITEVEIYSFVGTNIVECCCDLLINLKEPNLLKKVLSIVNMLLMKGDPNIYLDSFYKDSEDKITNVFKFQFDERGLENILSNISSNSKHESISQLSQMIIDHFYNGNKIIIE